MHAALDIIHTLRPHAHAHLEFKVSDSVSPFNRLGWGHEGPLSTAVRLLPRVLSLANPLRLLARAPLPAPLRSAFEGGKSRTRIGKARREKIERAMGLLDEAEAAGCDEVWAIRGDIKLGIEQDLPGAVQAYSTFLDSSADPHSQFMLGFFHATGLGNVKQDQGKAVLYYTMSALQGYKPAQMAMGYRYWAGIGVKEGFANATAYDRFLAGPPGGETLPLAPSRLSDRLGGIYGPHASWASTGINAQRAAVKASFAIARGETEREVLEYYQYHSDRDSHVYSVRLGRLFYLGSVYFLPGGVASGAEGVGEIPRNFDKAKAYFTKVARILWPTDYEVNGNVASKRRLSKEQEDAVRDPAMVAAAFLGRMALRGEGQKQDFKRARMWFERAADLVSDLGLTGARAADHQGEREAHNGLGIIYRDGLGVAANPSKAYRYFQAAAGQDLAEAQINLAKHHLEQNEVLQAVQLLEAALRHGSPYEAFHLLASVHAATARSPAAAARGGQGMCGVAVAYYKLASERGAWDELDVLGEADRAWARGDEGATLLGWWVASEMGHEMAQNNVAFMLDRGVDPWHQAERGALPLWTRSAAQDNVDAMVRVGDYYYAGQHAAALNLAAPTSSSSSSTPAVPAADYDLALTYYQMAADTSGSSLAYWNLGYMYEHARGVPRDWHLAKRFYDLALETSPEAYLPWLLSRVALHAHSWWVDVKSGGRIKRLPLFDDDTGGAGAGSGGMWAAIKGLFALPLDNDVDPDTEGGDGYEDVSGNGWGGGEDRDVDAEDMGESMLVLAVGAVIMGLLWLRGRWGRIGQGQQ